eukprot:Opistho-1_new@32679
MPASSSLLSRAPSFCAATMSALGLALDGWVMLFASAWRVTGSALPERVSSCPPPQAAIRTNKAIQPQRQEGSQRTKEVAVKVMQVLQNKAVHSQRNVQVRALSGYITKVMLHPPKRVDGDDLASGAQSGQT